MTDWRRLLPEESETWVRRAALAAELFGSIQGVADMGCGLMTLERFLAPGTRYIPVDLVRRDWRTIVCDFNRELPPATGVPNAACLGLIGYLDDPESFLSGLAENYRRAAVTYKVARPGAAVSFRRAQGLRSDFAMDEMEAMLARTGWRVEARHSITGVQTLWMIDRCRRPEQRDLETAPARDCRTLARS